MKKLFLILILFCGFLVPAFASENSDKAVLPSEKAQVLSVETFGDVKPSPDGELQQVKQSVEVKILTGGHKGEKVFIDNLLMGNPAYDINLKKGDRVILHVEQANQGVNFFIADKYRVGALHFLSGLFFLLLLIVGRKKGFFSLISILTTLGLIFCVLTPMILSGIESLPLRNTCFPMTSSGFLNPSSCILV